MNAKNSMIAICLMVWFASASAQPGLHRRPLQQATTVSGIVSEWAYNDDFEYDGLYLKNGNAQVFVKFPPHLAQQVRALGNQLTVNGELKYNPEGVQELKMISIGGNNQTVTDQKPPPPHTMSLQEERLVQSEGRISQVQTNKKGDVHGYILHNNIILRIPPHTARQLSQMIRTGTVIGYTGIEKALKPGHVRAFDYKIIHIQTISVNGTQYMIR